MSRLSRRDPAEQLDPAAAELVERIIAYAAQPQAASEDDSVLRLRGLQNVLAAAEDALPIGAVIANADGPGRVSMRVMGHRLGLARDTARNLVWRGGEAMGERGIRPRGVA